MLEMGHRMPDVSTTFDGNLARIRAHRNNISSLSKAATDEADRYRARVHQPPPR